MKRLMIILTILCTLIPCVCNMQAQELVTPPAGLPEETWRVLYNDYRELYTQSVSKMTRDKERLVTFVWDDDQLYVKGMFEDYPDSWIHASILWDKRIVFDRCTLICREDPEEEGSKPIYAENGIEISRCWDRYSISFDTNYDHTAENVQPSDFTQASCIYTLSEDGKSIESEVIFPNFSCVCSAFWYSPQAKGIGFYTYPGESMELPNLDVIANLRFEQVSGDDHSRDPNSHHAVPAIIPPVDLPQETWNMRYNTYMWNPDETSERSHERPVTFVWDDNTLYVKGIFHDYPECWMKATADGNIVRFEDSQLICEEDLIMNSFCPVYAMPGVLTAGFDSGTSGVSQNSGYHMNGYHDTFTWDSWFELSGDGKTLESSIPDYSKYYWPFRSYRSVFWYNIIPEGMRYDEGNNHYSGIQGTGYPIVLFPTDILFEKVSGGINDMTDSAKASDSNTYDLQGRQVNPDHLQPGIYIRNGKKIMAR